MYKILILDDDKEFCEKLKKNLRRKLNSLDPEIIITIVAEDAESLIVDSVKRHKPFDCFVIDQRLNGINGIELFQDLHRISPDSDSVIMTGFDDPDSGKKAYDAGASLYLPKPFESEQLAIFLNAIFQRRKIQNERDWLQVFYELADSTECCLSFKEAGDIIVKKILRLKFERARFYEVDNAPDTKTPETITCICQAGEENLPGFIGRKTKFTDTIYFERSKDSHQAQFFIGRELGKAQIDLICGDSFSPPVGEWAILPLRGNQNLLGMLVLDNAKVERRLTEEERKQLNLLAQMFSSTLERINLFAQKEKARKRLEIINQIGKHISSQASNENLENLLEEVRKQIARTINVNNFIIAMIDGIYQKVEFPIHYENGIKQNTRPAPIDEGMVGYLLEKGKVLYLPYGDENFVTKHNIKRRGNPSKCWVGIPLRSVDKNIGCIVFQDYEHTSAFSKEDVDLITAVSDQISGAIQVKQQYEQGQKESERMKILSRAGGDLMRFANQSKTWFWRTIATLSTANYGFSFNRIWIFLSEAGGARLRGVMGVGQIEQAEAFKDWENDSDFGMNYEKYLEQLQNNQISETPLEKITKGLMIQVDHTIFADILKSGQRKIIEPDQLPIAFPEKFLKQFHPSFCAVLPLRAGDNIVGLVVVDNKFDGKSIDTASLNRLETFLNQGGLVWQNVEQKKNWETLLKSTHSILSQTGEKPLGEVLDQICQLALQINKADFVLSYPFSPGKNDLEIEMEQWGCAGLDKENMRKIISAPRSNGLSAHILHSGIYIVNNVAEEKSQFIGKPLSEHPFILENKIKAFIGIPIRDPVKNNLGLIFFNYYSTQKFSNEDQLLAIYFANFAATAIQTDHQFREFHGQIQTEQTRGKFGQKELNVLKNILEEALISENDVKVIKAILDSIRILFASLQDQIEISATFILVRFEIEPDKYEHIEVLYKYHINLDGKLEESKESDERNISSYKDLLNRTETEIIQEMNKIFVPIRLSRVGIGGIECTSKGNSLPTEYFAVLERLSAAAALSLDNIYRQNHLHEMLNAAKAITAPATLQETFNKIIQVAWKVAPELSSLTVWYREKEDGEIKLGVERGVKNKSEIFNEVQENGSIVWKVINELSDPIYEDDISTNTFLNKNFNKIEGVCSAAAFPLIGNNQRVGAMFFNYRSPHNFTDEEKTLFHILAEIVAASIHDASLLEVAQRQKKYRDAALSISEAVGKSFESPEVLETILSKLSALFLDAKPCVLLFNEDDKVLEFAPPSFDYYKIDISDQKNTTSLKINDRAISCRVARKAISSGEVIICNVNDVCEDPDYLPMISSTRCELCVSLMSGKRLLGILVLESEKPNGFDDEEVQLIKAAAEQISLAIERVQQIAQMQFKNSIATFAAWGAEYAHETRTQIARIRNDVYWIREHWQEQIEMEKSLERIEQNLLIEGPWGEGNIEIIKLDEVLTEWVKEFINKKTAKRIPSTQLVFSLECPNLEIKTKPVFLQRPIRHILRNAIKVMGEKDFLYIRTKKAENNWIEIQIENTGEKIDKKIKLMIFNQPIPSPDGKRKGYGLLIARQMIENIGGQIRLVSNPEDKSIFSIHLPIFLENKG